MGDLLRDRRTPREFAARSQRIDFSEKINEFEQLATAVGRDLARLDAARMPSGWRDSPVVGWLSFGFADARETLPALEGLVEASIDAVCQRCLEPFRLPLRIELRLLFADDSPQRRYGEDWEVWDTAETPLCPLDLLGEVLVMAMPLAPKHSDMSMCRPTGASDDEKAALTTRPFAGLRARMEGKE